jgi:hypothetical protein
MHVTTEAAAPRIHRTVFPRVLLCCTVVGAYNVLSLYLAAVYRHGCGHSIS